MNKFTSLFAVAAALLLGNQCIAQSRVVQSFNDDWKFYKANNSTFFTDFENGQKYFESQSQWTKLEVWEDVTLPHTYNRTDMQTDRNFFEGKAVYTKTFSVDPASKDKRTFIKFEGVGAIAKLYINDNFIGEHKGGYSMFTYEITNSVNYDKPNTITVIADNASRKDIIPINQFLFPVYGGIYRPVHLITTNKTNFVVTDRAAPRIQIRQQNVSAKNADIEVSAKLETKEKTAQQAELWVEIRDYDGKLVQTEKQPVKISPQGVTYVKQSVKMKSPRLWDGIRDPYLYSVTAKIMSGGKELDVV